MFEVLVGNKSVERILLFLFVNEKCYGTQLHRVLGVPLTPIQKALSRLEQGGVITSYFEGKNRVYSFNPVYPLLNELEALLKKVYTLLPAQKKREYYVAKQELQERNLAQKNNAKTILEFWERLLKITRLTFHARSKNREGLGWNGKGQGEVVVTKEASNRLIFNEKGSWVGMDGSSTSFSNIFRWTLDRLAGVVSLEHLRRGPDQPVFLFHLAPSGPASLISVDSHFCGGDTYLGQLHFDQHGLRLQWRVIGLNKNEDLDYYYA